MNVLKITFRSIRRRFPQIWKAALTTLVAVFFVTSVLIFQENMYQWQMSSNKSRFGDWFICERSKKGANEVLSTIVIRNRINRRKEKIKLLHSLGMRRGKIVSVCMLEALRESVWCVITMPLLLLMELLMFRGFVRKL